MKKTTKKTQLPGSRQNKKIFARFRNYVVFKKKHKN